MPTFNMQNVHRNSSFINLTQLPLLCKKSGAVPLVQLGLMAGWQVDEMLLYLEIFKIIY